MAPSSSLLLSSLELSRTKVYAPQIRALLGTASHCCEEVVLKLRTVPIGTNATPHPVPGGASPRPGHQRAGHAPITTTGVCVGHTNRVLDTHISWSPTCWTPMTRYGHTHHGRRHTCQYGLVIISSRTAQTTNATPHLVPGGASRRPKTTSSSTRRPTVTGVRERASERERARERERERERERVCVCV